MRTALLVSMMLVLATRSATRVQPATENRVPFDREQSAALFVGVQQFDDPAFRSVRYAVDDAVDLAYVMAMETPVVPPSRVALALSGEPVKSESTTRLRKLLGKGAKRSPATAANVLTLLEQQAATTGRGGLLVLSVASHGLSKDGVPYVLAVDSQFRRDDTWLSTAKLLDIAARTPARRSVVFFDACRERVAATTSRVPAPLIRSMTRTEGQVVFYAAAAGSYAYDDDVRRNGVFTAAVIDGLHCNAKHDPSGLVTVDALATYVEDRVRAWLRQSRHVPVNGGAIQLSLDVGARAMPLATCR